MRITIEIPNTGLEEDILRKGEWEDNSLFGRSLRNALMHFTKESLEPKTGHWEPFDLTYGRDIYKCSVCKCATDVPTVLKIPMYKYCPNCGARMVEPQESEVERPKYFAYLDGVADGLNESRNDVNSVLDKIRAEIDGEYRVISKGTPKDDWAVIWNDCVDEVLQIIDKYRAESEEGV